MIQALNALYPLNKQSFKAFLDKSLSLQNLGLVSNAPIANLDEFDFQNSIIYATNADREQSLQPSESTAHKNLAFSLVELKPKISPSLSTSGDKGGGYDTTQKREFILRLLSRIIFCKFLEKKGIISDNLWDINLSADYYHEVLEPLFFTTLNTPQDLRDYGFLPRQIVEILSKIPYLNGGLFSPQTSDYFIPSNPHAHANTLKIDNALFDRLFATLDSYHFTIDEADESAEEVALDPELLGQIFESLLSQLFTDNKLDKLDKNSLRKATGSYYTPREIVRYMVRSAILLHLQTHLKGKVDSQALDSLIFSEDSSAIPTKSTQLILDSLSTLKILDPACGSGAFPMGILSEIIRLQDLLGDLRPHYARKLEILQSCIYGIDIQPMATEIARLRCFLSLIVDENPSDIKSLPNLEFKFISANSLLPLPKNDALQYDGYVRDMAELESLRTKYFNPDSTISKAQIQKSYTTLRTKIAKEILATNAQDTLDNPLLDYDPFNPHSTAQFFDSTYMFGVESFDIVIGNPPYIKEADNKKAFENTKNLRTYQGKMDIWYHFVGKGFDLVKNQSIVTFIATNNWTTNAGAQKLRNVILSESQILNLVDFGSYMCFDSASIQTMIMEFRKTKSIPKSYTINYSKIEAKNPTDEHRDAVLKRENFKDNIYLTPIITPSKLIDNNITFTRNFQQNNLLNKIAECSNFNFTQKEIGQGICPSLDDLFILKDISSFSTKETKYIKEWHTGLPQKYYVLPTNKFLIYMSAKNYKKDNLDDLPNLKKHFEPYKDKLTKAKIQYKTPNKPYFFLHREREERFFIKGNEKIISQVRCEIPTFAYSQENFYGLRALFFLQTNRISMKYLLGVLNSKLIAFWLKYKGKIQGNLYKIEKDSLLNIPIVEPNAKNQKIADKIVNLVDKVLESKAKDSQSDTTALESQIDDLVYKLYNLTFDEVKIIKS